MSAKLDGQLAKLQQKISDEHGRFVAAARVAVNEVLAGFGLTVDDLTTIQVIKVTGKAAPAKPAKPLNGAKADAAKPAKPVKAKKATRKPPFKGPQPAKYRDPESGKTWSGFGHAPAWIANAGNREVFLINGA